MKELINNVNRHLEIEEFEAILEACKVLEKGLKMKVFKCFINADETNVDMIHGIALSFDKWK